MPSQDTEQFRNSLEYKLGYQYMELLADKMCESTIWEQLVDAFPMLSKQLPNMVSVLNLFVSFFAIYCLHTGNYIIGVVSLLIRCYLDMLDGTVARRCDMVSRVGNIVDHIGDILFLLGYVIILCTHAIHPGFLKWIGLIMVSMAAIDIVYLMTNDEGKHIHPLFLWLNENLMILQLFTYVLLMYVLHK